VSQERGPDERPVIRRDADGSERTASSWETLTERLIREAQEDGAFDDLPDHGRPLRLDDDAYAGDMAPANRVLRSAGAAPAWIETDKEVRRHREAIDRLLARARHSPAGAHERLQREMALLADAHDDAVARLETLAPTTRQQRRPLERKLLRRRLEETLTGHTRS
jgi:hypothetical protein